MRIRYMKPGFFKNEELSELSAMHRLLFAGLWLMADKAGRLEDRPRRIKGELFPYENADVEPMLADLTQAGFLKRYLVNEIPVIQIVNFGKHQRPHKDEPVSQLPECVDSTQSYVDSPSEPAKIVRELERRTGTENGELDKGVAKAPTPTHEFLKWFVDEYRKQRNGAKYLVTQKHSGIAKRLVLAHGVERLKRLTQVLFGSDDEWIISTDCGIEVLAGKINWLEDRLKAWERKQELRVARG